MGDFVDLTYIQNIIQSRDLIALTNDDGSNATAVNTTVLDAIVIRAESRIKGFVQTKYSLPFTTVPETVKSLTLDLVRYYLYERKSKIDANLQVLYENTIDILKQIARGVITLDTEPGENAFQTDDTQSLVSVSSEEVPFTDEKLEGFI